MTEPRTSEPHWNNWEFWTQGRKGNRVDVPLGIVSIGYYRKQKRSTGEWFPVAVWVDETDGIKRVQVGMAAVQEFTTAEAEHDFDVDTFQYASKHPVRHADYLHWHEHRAWPEKLGLNPIAPPTAREAKPGDNSGATPEEQAALSAEMFADQVESALAGLVNVKSVATKKGAEYAQGLRNRLTSLASEGDKVREAEKRPHLEAGRAVDEKWNPHIRKAREGAKTAKAGVDSYAAAEAKRLREEAAARAVAGNVDTEKAQPVRIAAAQGRSAGTKEITTTCIVDQDLVYAQFRSHVDVVRVLAFLVQRVADNGGPALKGVEYGKRTIST